MDLSIKSRASAGIASRESWSKVGLDGLEGAADGRWPAEGGTEPTRNAAFIELASKSSSIGFSRSGSYLFSIV
jgi:hypothetical protein